MSNLTRRGFLKGLFAGAVVAQLPRTVFPVANMAVVQRPVQFYGSYIATTDEILLPGPEFVQMIGAQAGESLDMLGRVAWKMTHRAIPLNKSFRLALQEPEKTVWRRFSSLAEHSLVE